MQKRERSSKKLLVGCALTAGVVLVVVLAGGVATYLSIRRVTGPLMYLSGGMKLESGIVDKSEYRPPATGDLTSSQLADYLAVETEVESRLGEQIAVLRAKSEELVRLSQEGTKGLPVAETLRNFGPSGPLYLHGKKALVEALNRAGLSKDEFEWIREQAYHAAGIDVWQFECSDVIAGVADAQFNVRQLRHSAVASVRDRNLVGPHTDSLGRWKGLVFFGL